MNQPAHIDDARFLELLQKWHSGDFTRADEQEMYALAAKDAFRQETLEGYLEFPENTHHKNLASLQEKLKGKHKSLRKALPPFMAIAAAFVVLLGAIWFFNIKPLPKSDSIVLVDTIQQPIIETKAQQEQENNATASAPSRDVTTQPVATGPSNAGSSSQVLLDPRVADQAPTVSAPTVQDDILGENADLAEADDALSKPVTATEGAAADNTLERSTNVPSPQEMSKSARAAKKKLEAPGKSAPAKDSAVDKLKSNTTSITPVGGWELFRTYLNSNARLSPQALSNNISGTVRVQFVLDSNNQPADFQVLKKLGYGCDEEAIRLIKAYSWQRDNSNNPVFVDVLFVR
jgi:hypothetical protein